MIDWYIVLVPLAALPIVLLLVFVGCGLSTAGIPSTGAAVELYVGKGFDTDIASVKGMFQYTIAVGPHAGEKLDDTVTLEPPDLYEWASAATSLDLSKQPEGNLGCTCIITKMQSLEEFIATANQYKEGLVWEGNRFVLQREGDTFQLVNWEIPSEW